ncbi:MAG: hypothetical protein R3C68_11265 [Myxococcota bacterium]
MRLLKYFDKGLEAGVRLLVINYAIGVYRIGRMFARVVDGRRDPDITAGTVVRRLHMAAVLRVPSFNEARPAGGRTLSKASTR